MGWLVRLTGMSTQAIFALVIQLFGIVSTIVVVAYGYGKVFERINGHDKDMLETKDEVRSLRTDVNNINQRTARLEATMERRRQP